MKIVIAIGAIQYCIGWLMNAAGGVVFALGRDRQIKINS
jgi:hypothetical protein